MPLVFLCPTGTLRPRASEGGVLSVDSLAVLLRAIQGFPSVVSSDEVNMHPHIIHTLQPYSYDTLVMHPRITNPHITSAHTTPSPNTPSPNTYSETIPSPNTPTLPNHPLLTHHIQVRALANTVAQQRGAAEGKGDGNRSSSGTPSHSHSHTHPSSHTLAQTLSHITPSQTTFSMHSLNPLSQHLSTPINTRSLNTSSPHTLSTHFSLRGTRV